jgi:hypothetical protein
VSYIIARSSSAYPRSAQQHNATLRIGAGCSGAQNITLSGPGPVPVSDGPGDYAHNTQCTWRITAAGPITVVFQAFATEENYDFVTLVDGAGGEVRYSGVAMPPPFSTNSTSLTIVFTSDGSSGSSGFELELLALVPGVTWAPTAAPRWTNAPTNYPTEPTLAPDITGTPSADTNRITCALRHTCNACTSVYACARVRETR